MLWGMSRDLGEAPPERGVFANRTLNLRAVQAIGYDMDYTLIHYRVEAWERAAFEHARAVLARRDWPIEPLVFDPDQFTIGLVFDLKLGNLLKATRFGYVSRSRHGNSMLPFDEQRRIYQDTVVELGEPRYEFMNTLFELSRASLWTQLVEIHDRQPLGGVRSYADLYWAVDDALNETHNAGALKADIVADPERFVDLDPDIVTTLTDQRAAGKQLLLITNSDWAYAEQMMHHCIDPFCPDGETWRDLFDVVIVSAVKPYFFAETNPIYRVVDESQSLLRPHVGALEPGHVYFGGNARVVEQSLGASSGQPLYVGDHLFGDVHVAKHELRWRTALIVRELEDEIIAAVGVRRRPDHARAADGREGRGRSPTGPTPDVGTDVVEGPGARDRGRGRAGQENRTARQGCCRPRQPDVGSIDAGRQRQEPVRPPGRTLRRRVHLAGVESAIRDSLRLPACRPRFTPARRRRLSL